VRCTGPERRRKAAAARAQEGYTPREWERLNRRDEEEKRRQIRLGLMAAALLALVIALAYLAYYVLIRSHDYDLGVLYDKNSSTFGVSAYAMTDTAEGFAANLCVTDTDVNAGAVDLSALSAGLFDLTNLEVVYADDLFTTRSMASLTKVMTALVALKYGNMSDTVTVTDTVYDIEYGSSVCDIREGDRLTLKQLLYGMLIASGNDAAMMIAEYIGGSVDGFVEMMNEEALAIGCTRSHFMNPHGLTAEGHYSCAYDLYLMFQEALKYDMFEDIISRSNYYAEYTNAEGTATAVTWESTNHYFTGEAETPDDLIIYGGKTGTTDDAGACLILRVKDLYGNPYTAVLLHSDDKNVLYEDMNELLSLL